MTDKKTKYTEILERSKKTSNLKPIFNSYEGNNPLTEKEVKELIEIAFIRFYERILKKIKDFLKFW
jgi:hypothetical protein